MGQCYRLLKCLPAQVPGGVKERAEGSIFALKSKYTLQQKLLPLSSLLKFHYPQA